MRESDGRRERVTVSDTERQTEKERYIYTYIYIGREGVYVSE